jgi:hypothetical protein
MDFQFQTLTSTLARLDSFVRNNRWKSTRSCGNCDHSGLLDYQVKVISAASAGPLDFNEAWVMFLYETRTNIK